MMNGSFRSSDIHRENNEEKQRAGSPPKREKEGTDATTQGADYSSG